jgi:flavin prenyltransferase
MNRYIFAITGASGPILAIRLLREITRASEVHLIVSEGSFSIIRDETGLDWSTDTEIRAREYLGADRLFYHDNRDLSAPVASGSFRTDGMIIAPCSMKTLSGVACGYANNLIERAADVTIKEGRLLLISPREMPFSAIHLENMLKLSRLGVRIAPPVPAFYYKPAGIDDLVDFMAGKILDSIGIEHSLFRRWKS